MKLLVTGADGLLGANLVRSLIAKGHSIRAFIQPQSASPALEGLDIEKVQGDLLSEDGGFEKALSSCDAVFHCAAITDQWAKPELVWNVNLEGTRRVLDACISAKVKKLVFVGSASAFQFGTKENPGDETSPFPEIYKGVAYMSSKDAAMKLVNEYVSQKGLDAVIVAPTFILGPYDSRPSSGELIRQYIKQGLRFSSPGGRNFAYVGDVADAAASALDKGRTGEVYILGGENLTYMEFFGKVAQAAGGKPPAFIIPKPLIMLGGAAGSLYQAVSRKPALFNLQLAKFSCVGTYYSSAKAIKELGMNQTPIDRALEESIKSLKEYGHL